MKRKIHFLILVALFFLAPAETDAQEESDLAQLPGRIAYVGSDSNIYTLTPGLQEQQAITDDAGETRQYQWPTWARDEQLAYFSAYVEEGDLFMGAHISRDGRTPGDTVYNGESEVFQYAYWSPQGCAGAAGNDCRDLAVLISSASRGLLVEMIRSSEGQFSNFTAGTGAPFYYSWSPDGQRMVWQRNQRTFEVYDTASNEVIDTLTQVPGLIQAPAWSPVDDRLLLGALSANNTSTDLIIAGSDEPVTLAAELGGLVAYSWSPDGNYVAYRVLEQGDAFGALLVVDAVSGEVVARSPVTGVISFFWSPDSRKLAYITLAAPPGSFNAGTANTGKVALLAQQPVGLTWSVLTVAGGDVQRYGTFLPTQAMLYLLQFFDQFSQSHRIWSPDSKYLVYSEMTANGPVINVLDTTRTDSVPFSIADGIIGVWSF